MRLGKSDIKPGEYTLRGNKLEVSTEEKDIGVITDGDLKFYKHMAEKINKANGHN